MLAHSTTYAKPSELDQYLVQHDILTVDYKIKNVTALKEILDVISDEDSRTMPYQVDQNTVIEQSTTTDKQINIRGMIISPDFTQFVESTGYNNVKNMIKQNLIHNCDSMFEHQFQRVNPYVLNLQLSAEKTQFNVLLPNSECKFKTD
ncbi:MULTISPECIES: hypothetical protein [unclassified Acinetobacter]|uniref:hypothetical protein n=1 Tax=unclassified Acinetobacter TaxID=196816 RepID=UPI001D193983|nr:MULTISPECIES: hypothetical protein [unclassified Acinetobacter]